MKKVLLLLANGFEIFEASVFVDVIGWNYIDGDKSTQLFTCGRTKEVNSTFNQKIIVDCTFDEVNIDNYDALAIPGGFIEYDFYNDAYNEQFLEIIREFNKKGKIIASICVAALPLGKSGVLKGRKGTTYNKRSGIMQKQLKDFGVEVINQPIVIDQNIITSWNPSTAMEVAFLLLERLTNKENKEAVRELMGY
ncbi:DJ-1/PfpI family protein [Clostridium vincentii]|uniref:General stress protein 18 n=1 Tax=Clostridium vincentii TaxID=52704 RepID=A0A2T0B7I8_9CLOT|nr:DJ-1/PfpI family protein [Clostridium vincentii]PRR79859.1 General stress protein 18 [Clostridium vincentii]